MNKTFYFTEDFFELSNQSIPSLKDFSQDYSKIFINHQDVASPDENEEFQRRREECQKME